MVMWNWLRKTRRSKETTLMISGVGPLRFSMERLNDSHSLHMSGAAVVHEHPGTEVQFSVAITDEKSLRGLYGMLKGTLHDCDGHDHDEYEEILAKQGLLDGEPEDIHQDIIDTLGEFAKSWIHEPNSHLWLNTPDQMIREGKPWRVRDILRQIKHVGIS